jgi:hypothetical protein
MPFVALNTDLLWGLDLVYPAMPTLRQKDHAVVLHTPAALPSPVYVVSGLIMISRTSASERAPSRGIWAVRCSRRRP